MATLTLNNVTFTGGSGPFNGPALEFRFGNKLIGTATITQANTPVTFSGASGTIGGTEFLRVYQNGEPCRGMFVNAVSDSNSGPGTCEATAAVYGGGMLTVAYTVS
ncbi:hypothetical protein SPB21_21415 [Leptothoe sp. ISB3NOV94-8A]